MLRVGYPMNWRTILGTAAAAGFSAQARLTPQAHLRSVRADPNLSKKGEDFCWHAACSLHDVLRVGSLPRPLDLQSRRLLRSPVQAA